MLTSRSLYVQLTSNGWIAWIIIGLLAGWIAGTVTRGRGFGCLVDVALGLIGAVIGGWIFTRLGITTFGFIGSLAAATVGAVLLVAIARLFAGGRG
ncbi:MAG: GlsB/YeaQ/YmgE family stress response membrane protein [Candidatus Acidiferrales bacterium]